MKDALIDKSRLVRGTSVEEHNVFLGNWNFVSNAKSSKKL